MEMNFILLFALCLVYNSSGTDIYVGENSVEDYYSPEENPPVSRRAMPNADNSFFSTITKVMEHKLLNMMKKTMPRIGFLTDIVTIAVHGIGILSRETGSAISHILMQPAGAEKVTAETWLGHMFSKIITKYAVILLGDKMAPQVARLVQELFDRTISAMHKFMLLPESMQNPPWPWKDTLKHF